MKITALFTVLLVSSFNCSASLAEEINGLAISNNRVYGIENGEISPRTCRSAPQYQIDKISQNKIKIITDGKQVEVSALRSDSTYKGVAVDKYDVAQFPWKAGSPSPLSILIPQDRANEIYIMGLPTCPDAGYTAGSVGVLISPGRKGNLDAWLASNNGSINKGGTWHPGVKNFYWLDLPSGREDDLVKNLLSKDWGLDAMRESYPAGPDEVLLRFPLRSLLSDTTEQDALKDRIFDAIQSRLGQIVSKDQIKARRGYQYVLEIEGRAKDILADSKFSNKWLQTKIKIDVTTTGTVDGMTADRVVLNIPDGFLAVWRDNQQGPPPEDHIHEFQLTPESQDDFKGFKSLEELQTIIAATLASKLKGEVEFDPYAE